MNTTSADSFQQKSTEDTKAGGADRVYCQNFNPIVLPHRSPGYPPSPAQLLSYFSFPHPPLPPAQLAPLRYSLRIRKLRVSIHTLFRSPNTRSGIPEDGLRAMVSSGFPHYTANTVVRLHISFSIDSQPTSTAATPHWTLPPSLHVDQNTQKRFSRCASSS